MELRVTFYETIDGDKPLLEFLESLRGKQAPLHNSSLLGCES